MPNEESAKNTESPAEVECLIVARDLLLRKHTVPEGLEHFSAVVAVVTANGEE